MKNAELTPQELILNNVLKILNSRNLKQAALAEPLNITEGNVSKLINGKTKLTYNALSEIATFLSMNVIDIITYPDRYVKVETSDPEPVEAVLQIKLKKDKKDQVLKLVFGENNIEILNK